MKQIKDLRIAAGLSQAEVADVLGYSTPQFISNWERGVSLPPYSSCKKLSKLLNVPLYQLVDMLDSEKLKEFMDRNAVQKKKAGL